MPEQAPVVFVTLGLEGPSALVGQELRYQGMTRAARLQSWTVGKSEKDRSNWFTRGTMIFADGQVIPVTFVTCDPAYHERHRSPKGI